MDFIPTGRLATWKMDKSSTSGGKVQAQFSIFNPLKMFDRSLGIDLGEK